MVIESLYQNLSAIGIISQLRRTNQQLESNIEHIASGLRIGSAKDNPGSFILSNRLESQFRGLNEASANAQDGISFTEVANSAVNEIIAILQDIRTLSVQSANTGTSDLSSRYGLQADILEKIEEIQRIASRTKFNDKYIFNGIYQSMTGFQNGTRDFGGSVSFGPNTSTLQGVGAFLNLSVVQEGSEQIRAGSDNAFNTGILLGTDIAVSTGQFYDGVGGPALDTVRLTTLQFNRVSLQSGGSISYSGFLADGITAFGGTFSLGATRTIANFITDIQSAIDRAEQGLGIDSVLGNQDLETHVSLNPGTGRLEFNSGDAGVASQFSMNFSIENGAGTLQTQFGTDRVSSIAHEQFVTGGTQAKIGNSLTAITGSTFSSGTFDIDVSNVLSAQRRVITSTQGFFTNVSMTASVVAGGTIANSFIDGFKVSLNDVFLIQGTDPDGTTFTTAYTVQAVDGAVGNGIVTTFQDLVNELSYRDRSKTSTGFNMAVATLVSGEIQIQDDIADTSSTDFSFTIIDNTTSAAALTVDSNVTTAGNRETATISIAGGDSQIVTADQVVTLYGQDNDDPTLPTPQITLRIGSSLSNGSDQIQITEQIYEGSLNQGQSVQFRNGQQQVTFISGDRSDSSALFQQITMDFDTILDITSTSATGGETFLLSTYTQNLNFHIGSNSYEDKSFLFADLRPSNLGLNASENLENINITTLSGANQAIDIVDAALAQVNFVSARIGAFASRLESTVSMFDFTSLATEQAHSRIVSADIAKETTQLAINTILVEAQSSVLVQSMNLPQKMVEILLGLT